MIKPPFTLLILKDSHNPVTIRVTFGFLLTLCSIPVLFLVIGYFAASFVDIPAVASLPDFLTGGGRLTLGNNVHDGPEIASIDSDNNLTISYTPAVSDIERSFYFWVIFNPDAPDISKRLIYPRNPIDRGFPVDYRNGIMYRHDDQEGMTIRLRDELGDIDIDDFRILAYNDTGELILDRSYSPLDGNTR